DEILGGDHRDVVRSEERRVGKEGDQGGVLVVEGDGEALDLGLAGGEVLHGGVGDGVGPGELAAGSGAGGVAVLDRGERAQGGADRGSGCGNQVHVGEVDVGGADDDAVGEVAGGGDVFGAGADEILGGDHRDVV